MSYKMLLSRYHQNHGTLRFESTDHLRTFLKVKDIKSELNDVIVSNSMDEILKLIPSNNDLLDIIIKSSTKEQLNGIYNILQEEIQKFKTKQNNKFSKSPIASPPKSLISLKSYFNTISSESIENICSFLSHRDINYFKETSRRISIVCLNQMTKYLMKTCIAKKLLNSKTMKRILWKSIDNTLAIHNKYKHTTTYWSVFEEIERKYLIPQQCQIPIANKNKHYDSMYFPVQKHQSLPPKSALIVFDKRDIIMLDSRKCRRMTTDDIFDYNKNTVLTLHYFDIYKQEMRMVKQLIIDNSVTVAMLDKYIKNILIKQDNIGKYDKLQELLNNNTTSNDLIYIDIYSLRRFELNRTINSIGGSHKIISLIFQIDPTNLQSLNTFKLEYEVNLLQNFFSDGSKMLALHDHHQKKEVELKCRNLIELKENITDYMMMTNTFKEKQQNDIFKTIDTTFTSSVKLSYDNGLDIDVFKRYISKFVMSNVIPISYIQLYDINGAEFRINVFRTKLYVKVTPSKYNIQIYSESQAPFPFNYQDFASKEPIITTKLNIKNEDTVNDIVNTLIVKASNPSNVDIFNDIQESIEQYTHSITPNCYAVITSSFSRIYEPNDNELISNLKPNKAIKLFFLPFQNQDRSRRIKLEIRFLFKKQKTSYTELQFIGLPLIVFINKNDTLQHVLMNDESLQKYKNSIFYVYKVDIDQKKVTSIPQSKRNQYKLWKNLLSKNSKNFIVIKIRNRTATTMYGNQYHLKPSKFVSK